MSVSVVLFCFGLAVGSFLNVLALRFDGRWHAGGRSHCPHCKHTLRWFELIPLVSFIIQGGRCRKCRAKIGFRYPVAELISAAIFVFVPLYFVSAPWMLSAVWIFAFELLFLISYIDLRLQVVPDELTVLLAVAAILETALAGGWFLHLAGALFGAALFEFLVLVTKGRGMGMGDVLLAAPLGFLFGWPNIVFLSALAFVIGALVGVVLLLGHRKTMKSAVPFVPFLSIAAAFVFFFGDSVLGWYFRIIGI